MHHRFLLVLAASAPACQHDPHAGGYPTREPLAAEVVGSYGHDGSAATWSRFATSDLRECRVELRADGTFAASRIPAWPEVTLTDATGRWSIGVVAGNEHEKHWGVRFETIESSLVPAHLSGDGPPYGLILTLGDPDGGEAIFLARRDV